MALQGERPIIILGAGIIGLTTAVRLLESPLYQVSHNPIHIIADHLPNDPLDAKYASTIAGAHHLSFADDDDERQQRWDRKTFKVMYEEWRQEGETTGLMPLKQTELFVGQSKHLKIYEEHPDFTIIDKQTLPSAVDYSVSFTSITMSPLTYLNRLLGKINVLSAGTAKVHRHHLPSLSALTHPSIQAMIGPAPPLAVVVCAGLGALTLGGVEDTAMFPTRGQVVKIKAPWIKSGYTRQVGDLNGGEGGERTYIIPRADGEVILGGTREISDWMPYPRPDTTEDILKRAREICPELADVELEVDSSASMAAAGRVLGGTEGSPLRPFVLETLVGFRPSREGGTRLERGPDINLVDETAVSASQLPPTAIVYNYGHGGAGWQSCWGTAEDAVKLLEQALV